VAGELFETDEERGARNKRNALFLVSTLIILIALSGLFTLYEAMKPLPQLAACHALGYDAGMNGTRGETVCFANCTTKNVFECKNMKVIHP
jgi:hypothetical protein